MKKPKLECPEGHPVSDKWIMSMWGRLIQWKGYVRLGKEKMNKIKAENLKKTNKKIKTNE